MLNGYVVLAGGAVILSGIFALSWWLAKVCPLPRPMPYLYFKNPH